MLQQQNRLKIIFSSPQVLSQELLMLDSVLLETAAAMGARRIFIDGIALLRTVPATLHNGGNGNGDNLSHYRQLLQQLFEGLERAPDGAPVARGRGHRAAGLRPGNHGVPGGHRAPPAPRAAPGGTRRSLESRKSRGQAFDTGRHTLHITAGTGLEVFRRVQAPSLDLTRRQPTSLTRNSVIGSDPLDALFRGGVFDGSVTMVVGISGSGKTVLGTQLLLEGARNQKRGLMVSLDEHPE